MKNVYSNGPLYYIVHKAMRLIMVPHVIIKFRESRLTLCMLGIIS